MLEYNKVNIKLPNSQLNKLKKNAVKKNNGTTLRIGNKNFNKDQLTKLRDKVENNTSADIKSGGALGSILGRLLPKLIKAALSLGKKT